MSDSILIGIHDLVSKVILIESNDHLNMTFKGIFDTNVQKKIFRIQINYIQNTYFTKTCKKC